jgi:hypothetical protein
LEDTTIVTTDTNHETVLSHRYRLSDQVVVDRLGESLVAVQLGTDKIFELNETATRLVELLEEGRTAAEAADVIAGEYEASLEDVRNDVLSTIATLVAESMIEVAADAS